MNRRRILFAGEFSQLSTGFATYHREVMRRLHATGKYELAEFASYAAPNDPRAAGLPWKFYGVLPATQAEKKIYESDQRNQFGRYKFDAAVADWQPDITALILDPWMVEHVFTSRFRKMYKIFYMPTVDSAPQKRQWIEELYRKTDILTTYSRYGKGVLEKEGLLVGDVTSPGITLDVFRPLDKLAVREEFHLTPSLLVFGTVMRNQKRKLFPDLFDAYATLRNKYAPRQLVNRAKEKTRTGRSLSKNEKEALRIEHSVLYCHTSWPDLGWDLPDYIHRFGLQRHIVFTYKCDACKAVYADWFAPSDQKGMRICRLCGNHASHMPNTHSGVDEEWLVKIFNLFDVYIQPAICEGWGLPIMESKACGIPGLYQNYSAMEDHVENGGGLPIKVGRFFHEAETAAVRSLPDIDDLVAKMARLAFDDNLRLKLGKEARRCAEKMHSWDLTAAKIESLLDSVEISNRNDTWLRPPNIQFVNNTPPPANLSDGDFIAWLYINILGRAPDQKGFADWMSNLSNGSDRASIERFFREEIISSNTFESIRWAKATGQNMSRSVTNLEGILI